MTDILESANKLYNRNYVSFSRRNQEFGEALVFEGDGKMTILESEFRFHLRRAQEKNKPTKKIFCIEQSKNIIIPDMVDLHLELIDLLEKNGNK